MLLHATPSFRIASLKIVAEVGDDAVKVRDSILCNTCDVTYVARNKVMMTVLIISQWVSQDFAVSVLI